VNYLVFKINLKKYFLEELEFEDFERKTKISDRLCVKNVPSSSYVSLPTSLTTSSASSTRQEYEINNGATARKSLNTGVI